RLGAQLAGDGRRGGGARGGASCRPCAVRHGATAPRAVRRRAGRRGLVTAAASWVPGAEGSGFDVDHLPYGVFRPAAQLTAPADVTAPQRIGVRIADQVLDLAACAPGEARWSDLVAAPALTPLLAAGRGVWDDVRRWLTGVLTDAGQEQRLRPHLTPVDE